MKKEKIIVITMLSVFLLTLAGVVAAYDANYTITDYMCQAAPTIDGQYTGDEWIPSKATTFGTNGVFRNMWFYTTGAFEHQLIEASDATDDAEDYWEICLDGSADGGAAPQVDDFRVVVKGHGTSATVTWYQGSGTGWNTIAGPSTAFSQAQSLSTSPSINATHYILELAIVKTSTELGGPQILGQYYALRFAYNDAHTGGNGLQVWPPSSNRDVPNGWGYVTYEQNANPVPDVPEGFGIAVVLVLSSVAVVAGAVLLRKRPISKVAATL